MLPTRLEIKNFRSFSDTVLDFDFSSALIVGERMGDSRKSNGSGKSSLLEALCWGLFGETGDENADDIVKRGQVACEVILNFNHDNESYRIKRTRTARYSKMTTEFEQLLPDGTWRSRSGDTNKITDSLIQSIIKSNCQVFLNSAYFRQNSFFDFGEGTFSTRQALMSSLLSIDKWNKYQKFAKSKLDDLSDQAQNIKLQLLTSENYEAELTLVKQKIIDITAELSSLSKYDELTSFEILELEGKVSASSSSNQASQISSIIETLERQTKLLDKKVAELSTIKADIKIAQDSIVANTNAINELDNDAITIRAKIADINTAEIKDSVIKMEQLLLDGKSKKRSLLEQIKNLKENNECSLCGHNWGDPDAKHTLCLLKTNELDVIDGKLTRAQQKLEVTRKDLDLHNTLELRLAKDLAKKDGISSIIEHINFKLNRYNSAVEEIESSITQINISLSNNREKLSVISNNAESEMQVALINLLSEKKEDLKSAKAQQHALIFDLGSLNQRESRLNIDLIERQGLTTKLSDLNAQIVVLGKLTKVFGRDGVQAIIIDNVIEELSRIANQWLVEFCDEPTYVHFITQKQSTKGDWKETLDMEITTPSGVSRFKSLSGGERFRVSFAIRLALSALQSRRMGGETQILLLDEVSTSLDASGLEMFVSIIRKLERSLKVMVITHDDNLKEAFDKIITVKKTLVGSEVVYA